MSAEIVKWATAASRRTDDAEKASVVSPATMSHIISCLDLLSAHYDGLADAAAPHSAKFHLLNSLHDTLVADCFDERVRFFITISI